MFSYWITYYNLLVSACYKTPPCIPHSKFIILHPQGAGVICSEVRSLLASTRNDKGQDNVTKPLIIGLYYDDPESVPENELRFAIGAVLSTGVFCIPYSNIYISFRRGRVCSKPYNFLILWYFRGGIIRTFRT